VPMPDTTNFRYMFLIGLLSVMNWFEAPKFIVGWSDWTYVSAAGVNVNVVDAPVCVGVCVAVEAGVLVGVIVPEVANMIEAVDVPAA
jgi:hypothetical protein